MAMCVALGAGNLLAQQTAPASDVGDLLPADGTTVDVMERKVPPRMMELTKKLEDAIGKDPDWWLAHLRKAKPGEPVSYDPRLGVTKKEYEEYIALRKKITLTKVRTAKVRVQRGGQRIMLSFGEDLPAMKEVVLDLKADTVRTPFGVTTERSRIKASDGQTATGPWDGIQWRLEKVEKEPATRTSVSFAVGKLKDSGRGILIYEVRRVAEKSKTGASYILQYDLKKSH
jgi:hypothetical protein